MFIDSNSELGKPPKWLRRAIGPIIAAGTAFIPGAGPFLAPIVLAADQELQAQEAKKEAKKQQQRAIAAYQAEQARAAVPPAAPAKQDLSAMLPLAALAAVLLLGS
jgi:hypothetical protein